jgi:SSS family solute:Na+ symporter
MPLYMLMYPFLVVAAYYSLAQSFQLASPNDAFMAASVHLLPDWLLGVVATGATLSGLIVLAGISLAIGPLVTRNLLPHLPDSQQKTGVRIVIVLYLLISIILTLVTPTLMLTLINTAYFGVGQFFPGVLAILFFRRANPYAVLAGLITGDVLAIALYIWNPNLLGVNIGLVCLAVNVLISASGSVLARNGTSYMPVAVRRASAASSIGH